MGVRGELIDSLEMDLCRSAALDDTCMLDDQTCGIQ